MIYHALNRANFRSRLFRETAHYEDFLGIVEESLNFVPMRILAYCLMPNHWHLLLHPQAKEEIENIRYAIKRSRYGSEKWVAKAVAQFGLETTIRNPRRPEKDPPSRPTHRKGTRPPFP